LWKNKIVLDAVLANVTSPAPGEVGRVVDPAGVGDWPGTIALRFVEPTKT
jgi:hypothetical protein